MYQSKLLTILNKYISLNFGNAFRLILSKCLCNLFVCTRNFQIDKFLNEIILNLKKKPDNNQTIYIKLCSILIMKVFIKRMKNLISFVNPELESLLIKIIKSNDIDLKIEAIDLFETIVSCFNKSMTNTIKDHYKLFKSLLNEKSHSLKYTAFSRF